ncbi:zinc finger protein 235-like [Hetaerina americana]|uniref:zinc finger protein 235-like n=1 Tax=Hetaerina americana TaxID=62018 RepID=UPI003A7F3B87
MGSLRCTLCCGETFRTHLELAAHLETILQNIVCACCRLKFSNIQSLLDHYKAHSGQENKHVEEINKVEEPADTSGKVSLVPDPQIAQHIEYSPEDVEKREKVVNSDVSATESISAPKASDVHGDSAYLKEEGSGDIALEGSYYCSCGTVFTSLVDHLMNHHTGQEVIFKGEMEQIESLLKNGHDGEIRVVENSTSVKVDTPVKSEEPEVIICNRNTDEAVEKAGPPTSTPLTPSQIDQLDGKVEECFDKDGRVYLRKFVRVKKFWSEKDEALASQMKAKARDYDTIRDVPVGSVSIKSKDETINLAQSGQPKKLYRCSECEKTFQTMIHFKYHVCSNKNGSAMTCNLCGHESTSTKDLRAHWRMHQRQRRAAATALWELQAGDGLATNGNAVANKEVKELQCDRCGQMYLKSEELMHVHNDEPPYNCHKCSETFETREKLTQHMKFHRESKVHNCIYCGKSFLDSNSYKLHVRTHTGEKPYECQYCAKKFSRPYERMKHERIHTGERPHVCEICGKTFRVSYCLTLHKRTHSGDRPYTCETCGKRFKAHSAYKHHIQIHSDARNYKCPFCPKAFKTMVHLSGHKKTHTKPFLCTECNRRFASLYSMKSHMESHKTGKNSFRYRCFVCGASYARSFALHAHLSTHGPSDAPEDVAEVLEICGEDQKKEENDIGLLGECSKSIDKHNEKPGDEVGIKVK